MRSMRTCGPTATIRFCRTPAGASAMPQDQPIILSIEEDNPNRANVRFLIDNAALPADCDNYERVVLVFNGDDAEALAAAREQLDRLQGARIRGDLLAGRRARPLAAAAIAKFGN